MKFYEKFPQLQQKIFLSKMLIENVFATMSLENQQVPIEKITEIVEKMLAEKELEGTQFFHN